MKIKFINQLKKLGLAALLLISTVVNFNAIAMENETITKDIPALQANPVATCHIKEDWVRTLRVDAQVILNANKWLIDIAYELYCGIPNGSQLVESLILRPSFVQNAYLDRDIAKKMFAQQNNSNEAWLNSLGTEARLILDSNKPLLSLVYELRSSFPNKDTILESLILDPEFIEAAKQKIKFALIIFLQKAYSAIHDSDKEDLDVKSKEAVAKEYVQFFEQVIKIFDLNGTVFYTKVVNYINNLLATQLATSQKK